MDDFDAQYKSLNIIHAQNAQLYTTHLKHNNYISAFSSSLKEKITDEDHTKADLSIKKTDLKISLPYPVSDPFSWEIQPDPCMEIMKEKTQYKRKLETYRYLYRKDKNDINWGIIESQKKDCVNLPNYVVDLVLNGDKNQFFDGNYDWFYTGGSLEVVELCNSHLLINAQGNNIVCKNLSNSIQQQLNINVEAPIYSIRGYNINNQTFLTLRNKKQIEIVQLDFKSPRSFQLTSEVLYKTTNLDTPPFIDSLLFDSNKLITANVAYEVNIHDIEAKKISHQRKFDLDPNKKGELCQLDTVSNCLLFMGRDYLSLLDFRMSSEENEKKKAFKDGYFQCNELCAICVSSLNEHFVYLASKHDVYKCDLRKMAVVKKWTHLMDNSPIIIKTMIGNYNGEEYIFVASFNETICIHVSGSNHLPFKIGDINATFNKLKFEKEFILREDLERRFKLSTAGLTTHGSSVFVGNSIGDVFRHNINCDNNDEAVLQLKSYVDEVPHKPKQLQATHFKEQSTLRDVILTKEIDDERLVTYRVAAQNRLKKFLTPAKKFGKFDMALIWSSERAEVLQQNTTIDEQQDRIGTWLAQSAAGEFDPLEHEDEIEAV